MKPVFPFIKFFPSDWLSEESLRLVSFAARGLWIDLLCLMAKNERRGYLEIGGLTGGVNPTLAQIAKLVGSSEAEITPLLAELKEAGTCSTTPEGILFSRRMVRDTDAYNQSVKFGKTGGNPDLKPTKKTVNGGVNGGVTRGGQPPLTIISNTLTSNLSDPIPLLLQSPEFIKAFTDWKTHLAEKKKPLKPGSMAEKQQLRKLEDMGVANAVNAIRHSIAGNYQGIFEPAGKPYAKGPAPRAEIDEESEARAKLF